MRIIRIWLLILACALLITSGAAGEEKLTAEIKGSVLYIQWNTNSDGCVLTVYRNNWPFIVCNAAGSGSREVSLNGSGKYSVRLKTDAGCLTAAAETQKETFVPQKTNAPAATRIPQQSHKPVVTVKPAPTSPLEATARPVAKPTAAPTAAVDSANQTGLAAGVVSQVNVERAKQGLSALRVDDELTRAACVRAKEIVEKFSHTRPDGSSWSTVSAKAYGENIAKGQRTVDRVMASWMSSEGHRKNILRASFGSIGVCAYNYNGITYWVQLFGK